jgi:hypothetical protein
MIKIHINQLVKPNKLDYIFCGVGGLIIINVLILLIKVIF